MEKSKVVLLRCDEYAETRVYAAVKKGIDLLGGTSNFAKPGEKIVLKPNVLIGSSPERSVCTHPTVLKAIGRLLQEGGAKVSYGDSSAFGGCEFNLKRAGLKQAGDELGLEVADFDHGQGIVHPTALLNKKFTLAKGILEADGVISLPKLKTHNLTRFTGAIKNQFGCVPGAHKREFHFNIPDPYNFATMLVDITTFIRPRLFIMDGIVAMEGNGPFGGHSRKLSVLLLSTDPVAVDAIACKIIDLNPEFVPTFKPGEQSGLGTYHLENIELLGDNLDLFIIKDFKATRKPPVRATGNRVQRFIKNQLTPRPVIDREKCTSCGTCIKMCPFGDKVLNWTTDKQGKRVPGHKYSHCVRCYCCQETCPEGAISEKSTLLGKLIFKG